MIFRSDPVGWPGLAVMAAFYLVFFAMLLLARRRGRTPDGGESRRSPGSWIGIAVQGVGIGIACFGPIAIALGARDAVALIEAAAIAILMASATALFAMASRTMGRNWSLVARTRSDHQLVQSGPFAVVRHPIYVALFTLMIALAIAFGHTRQLILAIPLYALGTWLRITREERLLRAMFGADYDAYAARVSRFLPGVF